MRTEMKFQCPECKNIFTLAYDSRRMHKLLAIADEGKRISAIMKETHASCQCGKCYVSNVDFYGGCHYILNETHVRPKILDTCNQHYDEDYLSLSADSENIIAEITGPIAEKLKSMHNGWSLYSNNADSYIDMSLQMLHNNGEMTSIELYEDGHNPEGWFGDKNEQKMQTMILEKLKEFKSAAEQIINGKTNGMSADQMTIPK